MKNQQKESSKKGLSHAFTEIFLSDKGKLNSIIGHEDVKEQLKSALVSGRHIIIVGKPGVGKTTLANNVASLLPEITVNDCGFNCLPENPVCPSCIAGRTKKTKTISGTARMVRIQGSPDLTSEDIFGDIDPVRAMKYGPLSPEAFMPGKIFKANNGILFFDEINRCPEKLQNALLQAMEEKKITLGSYDVDFNIDFILIATMNPSDTNTEKLSSVLLDRFDLIYMGYPETESIEEEIVKKKGKKIIETGDKIIKTMVSFIWQLRQDSSIEEAPSVRATLGLYERTQAFALLRHKKKPDIYDFKDAVISVLAHRIKLKPSVKYLTTPQEFLEKNLKEFFEENRINIAESEKKSGSP